ncbi:MAG: hypothetical protein MK108_08335 [Mariniblastus sp.]|nr:hypothetical protein [Mariniblastus sp.]
MDAVRIQLNLFLLWLISSGLVCTPGALVAQDLSAEPTALTVAGDETPILFGHNQLKTKLRMSWGGAKPHRWQGSIRINEGWIRDIQPLGLSADTPGTIRLVKQHVAIQQHSAVVYSGFDCEVAGSPDTTIEIELTAIDQPDQQIVQTIRLNEVLANDKSIDVGQQTRLTITRAPDDELRLVTARKTMVFEIGEQFDFEIEANQTALPAGNATLVATLFPARSEEPLIWSDRINVEIDEQGSSGPTAVSVEVPVKEGVYDLYLELEPSRGIAPFRLAKSQVAKRSIQFVALNRNPIPGGFGENWETVVTIDPSSIAPPAPGFSFATISRFANFKPHPQVSSGDIKKVWIDQQNAIRIPPGGWQAIELPEGEGRAPKRLEINYDASTEGSIGFSILQSDSSGQFSSQGFDSGVVVPQSIVSDDSDSTLKPHHLQYWSHPGRSILLIANRHPSQPATVGKIRLAEGPRRLSEKAMQGNLKTRKLMEFFESPGFVERLGIEKQVDPKLGQPIDDWVVYYEALDRLIQRLKASGKHGAVVTVLADGSALFPSNELQPTPRYDTGTFAPNGRDPFRKDIVEMMYRMFEREGLWLVPALKFSSTLPAIEKFRDSNTEVHGFDLVNFRGDRPSELEAGALPYYNPLDVRVQKAITDAVVEFSDRYRHFRSFQGIALVCQPSANMGLPGRRWGYDEATRQRFIGSIEGSLETRPETWSDQQQLLLSDRYSEWMEWRRLQMSNWYREIHQQVSGDSPEFRTFIAPLDIFRYPEIESLVTPSLHQKPNMDDVMLRLGFSAEFFRQEAGITLLKPIRFAPSHPLAARRTEYELEHSGKLDRWFDESGASGTLISHRATWAHFRQLEQSEMFASQQLPLLRLQPFSLASGWNLQRFTRELKSNDAQMIIEGGRATPNDQPPLFDRFVNVYSNLPSQAFDEVPSTIEPDQTHPVTVRQYQAGNLQYFYAVNDSPWSVEVRLATANGLPSGIETFNADTELAIEEDTGSIAFNLEPFGVVGGRTEGSEFSFSEFSYQLPEEAAQALKQHYFKLRAKLIAASQSLALPVLQNPDFAAETGTLPKGWTISSPENFQVTTDEATEKSSLLLKSQGENVWIRSNEFDSPETGRLSISVWLRSDQTEEQPPLRLSVESTSRDAAYYRFGSVGKLAPDNQVNQIGTEWKRFAVHFDDLPTHEQSRLRIGFDLMGEGEVWIDRVEVYDRWFDENDVMAVTQLLASVGPLLSKPESLARCRNVLGGYWPRFLDFSFAGQEPDSRAPEFDDTAKVAEDEESANGIKQRLRRLNPPKWFQFR